MYRLGNSVGTVKAVECFLGSMPLNEVIAMLSGPLRSRGFVEHDGRLVSSCLQHIWGRLKKLRASFGERPADEAAEANAQRCLGSLQLAYGQNCISAYAALSQVHRNLPLTGQ